MSEIGKNIEQSAIKIAGKALQALENGDKAAAKFLAEQAAFALLLSKIAKKKRGTP
jgi:HEPN domain-containing protein